MKKILLIAMVMCIAIPAMAVTIGLTNNSDGTGTIYYTTTAGEVIRGISLRVSLSGGTLIAANPVAASINSEFNVFMDSAWFMEDQSQGSYNIGAGTPLAKHNGKGPLTPIAGKDEFSICMGVVDDTEPYDQGGATEGTGVALLTIEVDAETEVTIVEDALRGGIVGDNLVSATFIGGMTITMNPPVEYDFGDAPDPLDATAGEYPTLLANGGARHIILISGNPWLGDGNDAPDAETDGQPNGTATGDDGDGNDDENGVTFGGTLTAGDAAAVVTFEVNGPGGPYQVDGWIDFNANGVFEGGEKIVNGSYAVGVQAPTFAVPAGAAIGTTYARFRINTSTVLDPDDAAADGEVEDHTVVIVDCYTGQPDYAEWVSMGKPASWCNRYQCRGDLDDAQEEEGWIPFPFPGHYNYTYVGANDLALFLPAYRVLVGQLGENLAADLDHLQEEEGWIPFPFPGHYNYTRVGANDLALFLPQYRVLTGNAVPCGNPVLP